MKTRKIPGHIPVLYNYLSAMSVLFMLIRPDVKMIPVLLIWIVLSVYCIKKQPNRAPADWIFAGVTAFILSGYFYYYWIGIDKIKTLCAAFGLNNRIILFCIAVIFGITALPTLTVCFGIICGNSHENIKDIIFDKKHLSHREIAVILLTAVLTVTLFSRSSPLYPLNDWDDTNIFLTVGKSILHGNVLYVDIYEQKGPLLFFIYILPALISESSFIGVYFLEILTAFFFLFFSYKISEFFAGKEALFFLPAYAFVIYTAKSFVYGGSVEELCLPLLTCSLYQLTGIILTGRNTLSAKHSFINGLFIGCILWIKYTMLGMYIGFIAVLLIIYMRQKKYAELFRSAIYIAAGVVSVTVPVLIYFMVHHAVGELWTVYFYNNLFYYRVSNSVSTLQSEFSGLSSAFQNNRMVFLIIITGVLFLTRKSKKLALAWLVCLTATITFCYMRWTSIYYTFILCVFMPAGYAALCSLLHRFRKSLFSLKNRDISVISGSALLLIICIACFKTSGNTFLIGVPKSELPQYKMAEIINASDDRTILNYGTLDLGLYTTTGTIPNTRFFCQFNINAPGMLEEQENYVKDARTNFVATLGQKLDTDNYTLVYEENSIFDEVDMKYYLYQRNNE